MATKKTTPKHSRTRYGRAIYLGQKRIEKERERQRNILKKAGKYKR